MKMFCYFIILRASVVAEQRCDDPGDGLDEAERERERERGRGRERE